MYSSQRNKGNPIIPGGRLVEKWIYKVSCLRREGFLEIFGVVKFVRLKNWKWKLRQIWMLFRRNISMRKNMDSVLDERRFVWKLMLEESENLYIFFYFNSFELVDNLLVGFFRNYSIFVKKIFVLYK